MFGTGGGWNTQECDAHILHGMGHMKAFLCPWMGMFDMRQSGTLAGLREHAGEFDVIYILPRVGCLTQTKFVKCPWGFHPPTAGARHWLTHYIFHMILVLCRLINDHALQKFNMKGRSTPGESKRKAAFIATNSYALLIGHYVAVKDQCSQPFGRGVDVTHHFLSICLAVDTTFVDLYNCCTN